MSYAERVLDVAREEEIRLYPGNDVRINRLEISVAIH